MVRVSLPSRREKEGRGFTCEDEEPGFELGRSRLFFEGLDVGDEVRLSCQSPTRVSPCWLVSLSRRGMRVRVRWGSNRARHLD